MKDFRQALLRPDQSIRDALICLDKSGLQIALIVDEAGRLLGTVTDGDIRRFIIGGRNLDENVSLAMQRSPHTLPQGASRELAVRMMTRYGIAQVPILDTAGRLVSVEVIDTLKDEGMTSTWVVLMAGGLGTRLRPLTETTPKPLLPISGRPLMETVITQLAGQGFQNFYISVNYKAEMFENHFGDGSALGVNIRYVHEPSKMGTAGALSLLPDRPDGPFLVMNGDILTKADMRALLQFHQNEGGMATLAVREYSLQVPYGVVESNGHTVSRLVEKPTHRHFVNAGIYVLSPEVLDLLVPGEHKDMTDLLGDLLVSEKYANSVQSYPLHEYWLDIGRMSDLEQARQEFEGLFAEGDD